MEERRSLNFTENEINLLVELVNSNKDILENKTSNAVLWKEKKKTWEEIADIFFIQTNKSKTPKMLKEKWENIKRETRKKFAREKQEQYKTGGGQKSEHFFFTSTDLLIKDLIGVSVTGLPAKFDSDSVYPANNETITIEVVNEDVSEEVSRNEDETEVQETSLSPSLLNWKSWVDQAKGESPVGKANCEVRQVSNKKENTEKRSESGIDNKNKDLVCSQDGNNNKSSWKGWNPTKLKSPKPAALSDNLQSKPKQTSTKCKTQLTQDCRIRINQLSEARLELIHLQMECLNKELQMKAQEHQQRLDSLKEEQKQNNELHLLEIEKKKTELEILRRKYE